MHRIDTATTNPDAHGTGKAGFRASAGPGTSPTDLNADWFNALQEEIANVVEYHGDELVKGVYTQLLAVLARQHAKSALSCLRVAEDTGAGTTLAALAVDVGRTEVVAVGASAAIVKAQTVSTVGPLSAFAASTAGSGYTNDLSDVLWNPLASLFYICGKVGEIQTKPAHNNTWTRRRTGGADLNALATNGTGTVVAVGDSNTLLYSTTPGTWTAAVSPLSGTRNFVRVLFAAGRFVAVTNERDVIYSADGVTWTIGQDLSIGAATAYGLSYHVTIGFIFTCDAVAYHSPNGIAWEEVQSVYTFNGVLAGPYLWAAWFNDAAGTRLLGWHSVEEDAPVGFTVDYLISGPLTRAYIIDGQVWGLSGDKLYVGGVL